jgi:hypothetical protein
MVGIPRKVNLGSIKDDSPFYLLPERVDHIIPADFPGFLAPPGSAIMASNNHG